MLLANTYREKPDNYEANVNTYIFLIFFLLKYKIHFKLNDSLEGSKFAMINNDHKALNKQVIIFHVRKCISIT